MKNVFDGKIGDIVAIETTYNSQGVWEPRKTREDRPLRMEYQCATGITTAGSPATTSSSRPSTASTPWAG